MSVRAANGADGRRVSIVLPLRHFAELERRVGGTTTLTSQITQAVARYLRITPESTPND